MISALWLVPTAVGFGCFGFLLAALCVASHRHED